MQPHRVPEYGQWGDFPQGTSIVRGLLLAGYSAITMADENTVAVIWERLDTCDMVFATLDAREIGVPALKAELMTTSPQ